LRNGDHNPHYSHPRFCIAFILGGFDASLVIIRSSAAISSSFETSGYGATQPQRLSVATDNLWEGKFRFIVTVTDRRSFRTATKSEDFSIVK